MAKIILEVRGKQIAVPLKGTEEQVEAAIRRFVAYNVPTAASMTDAQIGRAALTLMVQRALEESRAKHMGELLAARRGEIAAQVAAENDLIDVIAENTANRGA